MSHRQLFDLIGILARKRFQAAEHHFATIGLSHTEARLLMLLDHAGGEASQEALSSQLMIDRSNAGRALKKLEQAGYVTRSKSQHDRRGFDVAMSPAGKEVIRDIVRLRDLIIEQLLCGLTPEEAEQAAMLLKKAADTASGAASRAVPH